MPKLRKDYKPVHQVLDEKITALLCTYNVDNPPSVAPGHDLYLQIAAKALGMTYAAARTKFDNGNPGVRSARANVKQKLFLITYGGGGRMNTE